MKKNQMQSLLCQRENEYMAAEDAFEARRAKLLEQIDDRLDLEAEEPLDVAWLKKRCKAVRRSHTALHRAKARLEKARDAAQAMGIEGAR